MMITLTIIHVVISIVLVLVVLMQHGKQQGLSGAIAGGAETFFGKNKGRTIDAMLKKLTSVIAALFIISSITFTAVAVNTYNQSNPTAEATEGVDPNGLQVSFDENGNLVDAEGNIVMTAEQVAEAETSAETEEDAAPAEAENSAEAEEDAAAAESAAPAEAE